MGTPSISLGEHHSHADILLCPENHLAYVLEEVHPLLEEVHPLLYFLLYYCSGCKLCKAYRPQRYGRISNPLLFLIILKASGFFFVNGQEERGAEMLLG